MKSFLIFAYYYIILNYPEDNNIEVSYGKLPYLNNTEIFYQCNIKEGSSGSPILLINNQKLIGVHNYNSKKYKYYKTKILIYLINEFSRIKNTNFRLINKERYTNENYIIAEFDIKGDNQNI